MPAVEYPGRLNIFQRLMCCWCELHPYNAAHIYRLAGPARPDALRDVLRRTFDRLQVGLAEISPDGERYRFEAEPDPLLEVLPAAADPDQQLTECVARGLNLRFGRPRSRCFACSVLDAGPDAHYLVVNYDHWVADSLGARLLFRYVLGDYCALSIPENAHPLERYAPDYRTAFPGRYRGRRAAAGLLRLAGNWWRLRRTVRPPMLSATQFEVSYGLYRAAQGTPNRLHAFARGLGATVQDVFLAALSRAVAEHLPRRSLRRGSRINVGTIVDTRHDAAIDLSATLGTFLSHYPTLLPHDPTASLADLTRQAAASTGPLKRRRRYLDAVVGMRIATAAWPRLGVAGRVGFLRRTAPYTAGVTNVITRQTWIEQHGGGQILDFLRAPPTGPMIPLVVAPTTFGDTLNVGVSYRVTAFTREKLTGIMQRFVELLESV